jgi:CDI immunity proteins
MARTDFSLSLEELTGWDVGDPNDPENAPTPMIQDILRSWKKPLCQLTDWEIGDLIVQHDGYPYVLDLVWPKLEADPLFDGGHYPGDVLSLLIRADPEIWASRPEYQAGLGSLYQRALERPLDENDTFRETLDLPGFGAAVN